jgi:hypothetical protein
LGLGARCIKDELENVYYFSGISLISVIVSGSFADSSFSVSNAKASQEIKLLYNG